MSNPIFHQDYSGFFPFYIGDYSTLTSAEKSLLITGFPLASLVKAFWYAKSFDVSINLAYSAEYRYTVGGVTDLTDSGTITSSSTTECGGITSSDLLPAQRVGAASSLMPRGANVCPGPINSGTVSFTPGAFNITQGPYTADFSVSDIGFGWNFGPSGIWLDASTGLYYTYVFLLLGGGLGTSVGAFIGDATFSSLPTQNILNLTIDGLTVTLPMNVSVPRVGVDSAITIVGSLVPCTASSFSGSIDINFNNFWT